MPTVSHKTPTPDLQTMFEDAAITVEQDDDTLYLRSGLEFPIWVAPSDGLSAIRLYTTIPLKDDVEFGRALEFANRLNIDVVMPQYSVRVDGEDSLQLVGEYFVPTEFGVESRQLINVARRFSAAFIHGVRLDTEDEFTA